MKLIRGINVFVRDDVCATKTMRKIKSWFHEALFMEKYHLYYYYSHYQLKFIHPLSFTHLGSGCGGGTRGIQSRRSAVKQCFQLCLGDPKAFPGQTGYIIPPRSSGSVTPSWTCPENLQRKVPRVHHPGWLSPASLRILSSPMTISEGWNVDLLVSQELCLPAQLHLNLNSLI